MRRALAIMGLLNADGNAPWASTVDLKKFGRISSGTLSRNAFFAGLFILGCASGLTSNVLDSLEQRGWVGAFLNTFNVSIIVWISCYVGVWLILQSIDEDVTLLDKIVGGTFVLLTILPVGQMSWIAIAALSIYFMRNSEDITSRQGAVILLATTVPMVWSQLIFRFLANTILNFDATLVSWILGAQKSGNIVDFADKSGRLVILPACSSLSHVSVAVLCWVTISRLVDHKRSLLDIFWCLSACASVVVVNVTRMGIMGLSKQNYDAVHSFSGEALANLMIFGLATCFCLLGVRRELLSRL